MKWSFNLVRVRGIEIKIHLTFLLILTSYQPDFAVVLANRLLGVVTRDDVLRTLAARSDDPYVAEIMQREVPQVEASAGIDEVQERMGSEQARLVAVCAGERFLGLVSREDLSEALSVLLFTARRENAHESLGRA